MPYPISKRRECVRIPNHLCLWLGNAESCPLTLHTVVNETPTRVLSELPWSTSVCCIVDVSQPHITALAAACSTFDGLAADTVATKHAHHMLVDHATLLRNGTSLELS